MRLLIILLSLPFVIMLMGGCSDRLAEDTSSFGLMESRILATSCAIPSCHASGQDATFAQHRLVLARGKAFDNLLNTESVNPEAKAAGLLRVKPGDAASSLLYHKLLRNTGHHGGAYGNPMPLGLEKLSVGQLEFIKEWIEAGAPRSGSTGDPALLDDKTPQPDYFQQLTPPEQGYQVHIEPFTIVPGFEREFYVYKPLGNTEEVFVNRIQISMRENSHHLVVHDFKSDTPPNLLPDPEVVRDIRSTTGALNVANLGIVGYHVFAAGSQTQLHDYQFPPGVAFRLPAGKSFDFNPHYVNKGTEPIYGEAYINFYTVPSGSVVHQARSLQLTNQNLDLPPGRSTVSKTFLFDRRVRIVLLTSHTHRFGEKFLIRIKGGPRDGELVYESSDWNHPVMADYPTPITLLAGEGLTSIITYNNTSTSTVGFGLKSTDEMGIIFGYYYED